MKFMTIASGSSGNCIYVGNEDTHILIDTGISKKRIEEGLKALDLSLKDINGILVTHEHSDHIGGLGVVLRKAAIPVYATKGTIDGIKSASLGKLPEDILKPITSDTFSLGSLSVTRVKTSHDANEPCAYRISDGQKSFGLMTDLGFYDENIVKSFLDCDSIMVEANHDIRMLETGPYPYPLKVRILGNKGHLSNEASGNLINELLNDKINNIILAHLSKENNYPDLAYETVRGMIDVADNKYKAKDFNLQVARREMPGDILLV